MSRKRNHDISPYILEENQGWESAKFETDLAKVENEGDLRVLLKSMQVELAKMNKEIAGIEKSDIHFCWKNGQRNTLKFQINLVDKKITKLREEARDGLGVLFKEEETPQYEKIIYREETHHLTPKHAKIFNKLKKFNERFDLAIRNHEIAVIETKPGKWSKKVSMQLQKLLIDKAAKKLLENMGDEPEQWVGIKDGMIIAFCSDFITKPLGNLNLGNVTEFYAGRLKKWPKSICKYKITHLKYGGNLKNLEEFTAQNFCFLDVSGRYHEINDSEGEKLPNHEWKIAASTKNGMITWKMPKIVAENS